MNVSVSPAAQQELIDGAMFYAERADRELGLAFIAEFEHARDLLSTNPEIGAHRLFQTSLDVPLTAFLSYPHGVRMMVTVVFQGCYLD